MPLVSVIVPSYNHGRYLQTCLDSVLAQSFDDWEIVLVDDGSKDDSLAIAESYRSERIRIVSNERNLGTYATQNRAVELAQGEFIAVLNSDDHWHPDKLLRQVESLDRYPDAPFCYCRGTTSDAAGEIDRSLDIHGDFPREERHELLPHLLEWNRVLASSVVFRRRHARFEPTLRYSGDWFALLQASLSGPAALVPEPLTVWRIHDLGTHRELAGVFGAEIRFREWLLRNEVSFRLERFGEADLREVNRRLGMCAFHLAALYLLHGRRGAAVRSMWEAKRRLGWKPSILKRILAAAVLPGRALSRMWPHIPNAPLPLSTEPFALQLHAAGRE